MWLHGSWRQRPHFVEIDKHYQISYNGNFFHGHAEFQHHPKLDTPRIGLQFSPVKHGSILRRFVFIHISGTANYLYENEDNYSCILMQLIEAKNLYQQMSYTSITPTTLACNNPQKKRRFTFTTDEEEAEKTFREFEKTQEDFVEPPPTPIMKAIEFTAAHYKDKLLRSTLCRQPDGRDDADNIIVNSVMTAASVEQKAQETQERFLIFDSPLSSYPSSSSTSNLD